MNDIFPNVPGDTFANVSIAMGTAWKGGKRSELSLIAAAAAMSLDKLNLPHLKKPDPLEWKSAKQAKGANRYLKLSNKEAGILHSAISRAMFERGAAGSQGHSDLECTEKVVAYASHALSALFVVEGVKRKRFANENLNAAQKQLVEYARKDDGFLYDLKNLKQGSLDLLSQKTAEYLKEALDFPRQGAASEIARNAGLMISDIDRSWRHLPSLAEVPFSPVNPKDEIAICRFHENDGTTGFAKLDDAIKIIEYVGEGRIEEFCRFEEFDDDIDEGIMLDPEEKGDRNWNGSTPSAFMMKAQARILMERHLHEPKSPADIALTILADVKEMERSYNLVNSHTTKRSEDEIEIARILSDGRHQDLPVNSMKMLRQKIDAGSDGSLSALDILKVHALGVNIQEERGLLIQRHPQMHATLEANMLQR